MTMEGAQDTVSFDLPNVSEGRESFTLRTLRDFHGRVQRNYQEFLAGELSIRDVLRKPVDLFQYAFVTVLDGLHLKMGGGVNVRLSSNIPMGCGMGSSAAARWIRTWAKSAKMRQSRFSLASARVLRDGARRRPE